MRKKINFKAISVGCIFFSALVFLFSFVNNMYTAEMLLGEVVPAFEPYRSALSAPPQAVANAGDTIVSLLEDGGVIGLSTVVFEEYHANYEDIQTVLDTRILSPFDVEALRDPDRLRTTMYTVDPRTAFLPEMFDIDRFLAKDMRIDYQNRAVGLPQVLIFHTHSTEFFVDSYTGDKFSGIVGVGHYLAQLLNGMGINTIHLTDRFDFIDGQSHIMGAYERQVPRINEVLAANPSIEIVIDMHRDGLPEGTPPLVTYIDGRRTAQIMFFNGLSLLNDGGIPTPIAHLPNPYIPYNLAFSFQMQLAANQLFPGFTRRIYLHAFRYSLHFRPRSLLLEIGAQNNTFEEAINAMYPLAEVLAAVLAPHNETP